MIKLIFMYTRPKLTISTKKKKFKKNCLKKVCKLGILGHSAAASSEFVILLLELKETDTTFVGGVITTDGE